MSLIADYNSKRFTDYQSDCDTAEAISNKAYTDYYDNVDAEYNKFLKTEMSYKDASDFITDIRVLDTFDLSPSDMCEIRINVLAKHPDTHSKIAEYFMGEGM